MSYVTLPQHRVMRPAQLQDRRQLAQLNRGWEDDLAPSQAKRWRNFAILAILAFSILVGLKSLHLLGMVLLGFAPIYGLFGWFYWLSCHPPQADWMNYWVIESVGKITACAKWVHFDAYSELQQIYVVPKWRSQGLGTALVERCLSQTQQPVYVISDRQHGQFFNRLGFVAIAWDDLPDNFPITEFAVPGLERSRDHQVPMRFSH